MILYSLILLFISVFTTAEQDSPKKEYTGFTRLQRYKCALSSTDSFLETEIIMDSLGRNLILKRFEEGREIEIYRYVYRDTLEYDNTFRKNLNTTYCYSNNEFIAKEIFEPNNLLYKRIGEDSTIELYLRKYSKDSLLQEETEFIDTLKEYTYKFEYDDKKKLKTKYYSYSNCCSGKQPIIDRIEYAYDEKTGDLIQECKIMDKAVERSYKTGRFKTMSFCDCTFTKHINDTTKEVIYFQNFDTTIPNFEKGDKNDLYYRYIYSKLK